VEGAKNLRAARAMYEIFHVTADKSRAESSIERSSRKTDTQPRPGFNLQHENMGQQFGVDSAGQDIRSAAARQKIA